MSNKRHRQEAEMDEAIEIQGLDELWPTGSPSGHSQPWRPGAPGMRPEPEGLALTLRYRGEAYQVLLVRSVEGARTLGTEERELERLSRHFAFSPGWVVSVSGPRGRHVSFPYPTLEAAILGALSMPHMLWRRGNKGGDAIVR
jgi:hypothetical protein